DNVVSLTFPQLGVTTEHGVDIGSAEHITARGNFVEQSAVIDSSAIMGFFVEGAFGPLAVLRDNQVRRCGTSFHARGTNLTPAGAVPVGKWLLADNVGAQRFTLISTATNFDKDNTVG